SETFYEGVSYGFQFEDIFITNDGRQKVLVMQKVELDETPKLCPSCLTEQHRGNSYPRMLYKSFECQNPACPSRSKIGRGKRFDLFGAKRQMMLERNSENDRIKDDLYSAYRRDIIDKEHCNLESFVSLYSWDGDSILGINVDGRIGEVYRNRTINYVSLSDELASLKRAEVIRFEELPIVKLFKTLSSRIVFPDTVCLKKQNYDGNWFIHGNSSRLMQALDDEKLGIIGSAITSPPYYNAREYSQWPNMICYFIDMMINATSAYKALKKEAVYIYNIGDIVGQDNIYIHSNMSKRRQMLGFYSVMLFNLVGFNINTNIIWDKGEVQSKRNSSSNHISGYIKPVNAYEHDLVFVKGDAVLHSTEVKRIETVKKINSKGQNVLGHTAPYPIEIAELILPYSRQGELIMDPYLGSGTTLIAAFKNGYNGIGIEMNDTYYDLAINRYLQESTTLSIEIL
ncbi:TPA: site-specific DNA-methyltransferase, partial [Streptococcus suis]